MANQDLREICVPPEPMSYIKAGLILDIASIPPPKHLTHKINGKTVLEYTQPQIGGGVANRYNPALKIDGTLLKSGFIALQSEGQEIDFRNIEVLDLSKE